MPLTNHLASLRQPGPKPRLQTLRLTLELQAEAHVAEMFAVLSDPAIYEFENAPPKSLAWLAERFKKLEAGASADGRERWLNWVVRGQQSAHLMGYVQATVLPDSTALVAYEFNSQYWGQGFASEAVRALLHELASQHAVSRALAVFKTANH